MRFCIGLSTIVVLASSWAAEPSQHSVRIIQPELRNGKPVMAAAVAPRNVSEGVVTAHAPARPAATTRAASGINQTVQQIAANQGISAELIHAVIKVESNYNPRAISSKGARGLMQLEPSTARRFGVADVYDPVDNIAGGVKYLRYLLDLYGGDYPLALAAYNAGEAVVARYAGVPPYLETQRYLYKIWRQLQRIDKSTAREKDPEAK